MLDTEHSSSACFWKPWRSSVSQHTGWMRTPVSGRDADGRQLQRQCQADARGYAAYYARRVASHTRAGPHARRVEGAHLGLGQHAHQTEGARQLAALGCGLTAHDGTRSRNAMHRSPAAHACGLSTIDASTGLGRGSADTR